MARFELKIKNIDCPCCTEAITKKLKSIQGVGGVDVDLKGKKINVQTDNRNLCQEDLNCVVEDLGYKVQVP